MDATILGVLEARIAAGEAFMRANPQETRAEAAVLDLVAKHMAILSGKSPREVLNYVTLALPANTAYQPEGSEDKFDTVRVCFQGKPEKAGDITVQQLGEIVESVKLVKGARG